MKKHFQRLKAYKWHLIYGAICSALALTFVFMVVDKYYLHSEENILYAVDKKQRVMLDLKTGNLVDEFSHVEELRKQAIEQRKKALADANATKVSVIVSELGVNDKNTTRAFSLPKEVGFSFSPYAPKSLEYSQLAYNQDRQTFVELPMDPGVAANRPAVKFELNEKNNEFTNQKNLDVVITKAFSPLGVVMPRDEIFSYSDQMPFVIDELAKKNMSIIYKGKNLEKMRVLADNAGSKLIIADLTIDDLISAVEIKAKLEDLENISKENGNALIVVKAYPITLNIVNEWIGLLPQKGYQLTPPLPVAD